jgi:hypothetical protein
MLGPYLLIRIVSGAWIARSLNGRSTPRQAPLTLSRIVVCVLRRVVAANASLFFTIHHLPAQLTVLRFADFPDAPLGMIERLERALALAGYIVLRHGLVHAPYIDRLERELEAARRDDPTKRARRIL